jgi:hypothetical protein
LRLRVFFTRRHCHFSLWPDQPINETPNFLKHFMKRHLAKMSGPRQRGNVSFVSAFLMFFVFISLVCGAETQMLDKISATVVYLHRDIVETTTLDGAKYEVYLKVPGKEIFIPKTTKRAGTGFLIMDGPLMFLVTAQHVASLMRPDSFATIRAPGDRPMTFTLDKLSGITGQLRWVYHDTADVAVLTLHPPADVDSLLTEHFLAKEIVFGKLEAPLRNRPLTTIGFPLGLGVEGRFSPISRESKPASGLLNIPRFDTKQQSTFYLLDNPSIGGFSGAPIFQLPGTYSSDAALTFSRNVACVGLIHGTISDDTGGKLAAAVPSVFIIETIDKAKDRQ